MLFNKTRNRKLVEKTEIADSFLKRFRGLMFRGKPDYALVFELEKETRLGASIHMLFVFFPIDVVYLDSGKKVVDIKSGLKPWSLNYTPKKAAKYFVEFPVGKLREKIGLGDVLQWD